MSFIPRIFSALLAISLVSTLHAGDSKLKMITVNMQTIFDEYNLAIEAQKEADEITAEINKDNEGRVEKIKEVDAAIKLLTKQVQDTTISETKRQELFRDRQLKAQEGQALQRERGEFLERRKRALAEKMAIRKDEIIAKIGKKVEEQAKLKGYDFVFGEYDLNGNQVTVVLYAKGAKDGTAEILKALNK